MNVQHQTVQLFKLAAAVVAASVTGFAQDSAAKKNRRPDDDPRVTPTVKLVRQCLPALVSVRVARETNQQNVVEFGHGGGSVIHAKGYILTNNHVVAGAGHVEIAFFQGPWRRVQVVARLPSEDLALLKLDGDDPFPTLPLGRTDDLELGEPVITLGSPGGLPHTLSAGLVSGLGRATHTEHAHLPSMVQTTAPVSGGSSGGALINALGEQIGVITSRKADGENLGFAITIDRVRKVMPRLIAADQRYGITHGVTVDPFAGAARITAIGDGSPGAVAGLATGDVIERIDDASLRHGVDFHLEMIDRQPGDELALSVRRGDQSLKIALRLAEAELLEPAADIEVEPGLRVERFSGQWDRLPNFDKLQPQETSISKSSPRTVKDPEEEFFGQRFTGFLKIPTEGVYFLSTISDDGSRLWLGERMIVDNDGLHAEQQVTGMIRLRPGMYPLRLDYFEAGGDQALRVMIEGPGVKGKQRLPAKWLFHSP